MERSNPYQPPQELSPRHVDSLAGKTYPANQCPSCGTKITLWMSLWQATPFRFKCTTCRAAYRVLTPHMKLIFAVIVCGLAAQTIVMGIWAAQTSTLMLIPGGLLYLGTIGLLEGWAHRRVGKHGRLIQYEATIRFTEHVQR